MGDKCHIRASRNWGTPVFDILEKPHRILLSDVSGLSQRIHYSKALFYRHNLGIKFSFPSPPLEIPFSENIYGKLHAGMQAYFLSEQ
jgi:hypothetical protein